MSLHALVINDRTVDFVTQANGGVRPVLTEPFMRFVYSDHPQDEHVNEIMTPFEFHDKYEYADPNQGFNDNLMVVLR